MSENKKRLFEVMSKLDDSFKPKLNENSAYNDAGEPMMTHQQFNDYSEPAEPEYDDHNEQPYNEMEYLTKELEKINVFLETFDGNEHFIRTISDSGTDFLVYPHGDYFDVQINDDKHEDISLDGVIELVNANKNIFLPYDKAVIEREREMEIDAQDNSNYGRFGESMEKADQSYTHFAVLKDNGKIVNGWDYGEYSNEELRTFKNDYFAEDLLSMDIRPTQVNILTADTLKKRGVDPYDFNNWNT